MVKTQGIAAVFCVQTLSRVAFQVPVERPSGLETLAAHAADVRLLPGVDQDVPLQVHLLHEALAAHLAQEAALLVVEADVRVQRLLLGEALAADAAGEGALARVDLQVRLQVAGLVEGLAAEAAGERLLPGVDPGVHQQGGVAGEGLPAGVAGAAGVAVSLHVNDETLGGLVLVPTDGAAAVRIQQVRLGVLLQEDLPVEGMVADFAAVRRRGAATPLGLLGPVCLVSRHVLPQGGQVTELLAADGAGVHRVLAVLLHVALQRRQVTEGAGTLLTLEGFLRVVHVQVRRQVALLGELFATHRAAVGLFSSVQANVQLLRQDGVEGLPAEGAGLAAFPMNIQVSRQAVGRV